MVAEDAPGSRSDGGAFSPTDPTAMESKQDNTTLVPVSQTARNPLRALERMG